MRIDIITIFPQEVKSFLQSSILGRAQKAGVATIEVHDLRDWTQDKHRQVDDRPYGGGPGMVLRVDVLHAAITAIKQENPTAPVILLTPQGETYRQSQAEKFSQLEGLILVAGHYEGFDDRIRYYVDQEISVGDYVLTGGELPAMLIADSVVRLLPGALGDDGSALDDSFSSTIEGKLDFPQYTRPEEFNSQTVPEVLLSGNHALIEKWRREQSQQRTKERRPDLN